MTSNLSGIGLHRNFVIASVKTHQHSTAYESEILRFFTLTFVTLVKVKGHVTLARYCPLDTNIFYNIMKQSLPYCNVTSRYVTSEVTPG